MSAAPTLDLGSSGSAGDLILEQATEAHWPFVLDAWVRSYQSLAPPYAKTYGMGTWDWTKHCASRLIGRGAVCLVARFVGIENAYLGFGCAERGTIHYVYVRSAFGPGSPPLRRRGFAAAIVGELVTQCGPIRRITHRPGSGRGNLRDKCHRLGWRHEPLTREEVERT